MTRRQLVTPLALVAVAAVAAVAWWIPANPPRATAGDDAVAPLPWPITAERTASGAAGSGDGESPPAIDDGHRGLGDEDLWAYISNPASSDLPPELFADLSQLGADIVRADTTGDGRDRWPNYWDHAVTGRSEACCTDIEVVATGAYPDPDDAEIVRVTVVWSGEDRRGSRLDEQITDLRLVQQHGAWHPAR